MSSLSDVARRAGVSKATASRALSGAAHVSPAARDRVATAASDLGYVVSSTAASLVTGRTKNVGVITPFINRWFFAEVLEGIEAAVATGLKVKINTVALKHDNAHEIPNLVKWAHARGHDITLIETMPLGEIDEDRTDQFLSLTRVREDMQSYWRLTDLPDRTGGPARYVRVEDTGGRLGFITPLTHNFCEGCSRVRLTCTGRLYLCLGHETSVDLRTPLRAGGDDDALQAAIDAAIALRPKGHDFQIERLSTPATERHMSVTGG